MTSKKLSKKKTDIQRLKNKANVRLYDRKHPNYHYYAFDGKICSVNDKCSVDIIAKINRMHPAPGTFTNTVPVKNGQPGFASLGYKDAEFDDFGPIVHIVSNDGLSVINYTLPDHKLFPGYVKRIVIQKNDDIYIRTIGEGIGELPNLNEDLARPLWNGIVNSHIRYRVNLQYRTR